jgi:16S rRNA (cytidine1402-2'-O)-methyltransferase
VVARELTKTFEQVRRGTAQELIDFYQLYPAKGECVVLIGPLDQNNDRWDEDRLKEAIVNNLSAHKPRQLAHHLSEPSRWSSSEIYALITDIKKK